MKLFLRLAFATAAFAVSVPASAAIILNGSSDVAPTAGVPASQGTLLALQSTSLPALTFATTFLQGVYRNGFGTLDFYYQVTRTGPGSLNDTGEIDKFTVSSFAGFVIDGFATGATDPDGAGPFQGGANSFLADGVTPSGSTTTFGRSASGDILRVDFGLNGLSGSERSTTYIFRTNATDFDNLGTFGVLNGSSVQGLAFRPLLAQAVPEPSTWMMMLLGFGGIGLTMRKRRRAADRLSLPA